MDPKDLRARHTTFTYESFEYRLEDEYLFIKFHFHISPDIDFYPIIKIPVQNKPMEALDNFVFHLGLVEMISYWKATCSPALVIKTGKLTNSQVAWWKDLMINGLGEFFYQNKIDFNEENFLEITCDSDSMYTISDNEALEGDLILMGGGKDSAVTGEALGRGANAMLLNPTIAALNTSKIAGFHLPIIVTREIDQKLLELNEAGYLNGHTPFSAYLSFLSLLVARVYGFKNVIVSNEKSAGEANLNYLGLEVNHQYSKSFRYESHFREYVDEYLSEKINYFSFLRPLSELQIALLFSETTKYDKAFNSCNSSRNKYWCGECAKCAFVYLIFSGLLEKDRLQAIFGNKDLFENEKIKGYIKDLTGDGKHKPLDCVGTEDESRLAKELIAASDETKKEIIVKLKTDWGNEHFLPKAYVDILKKQMENVRN